MTTQYVIADRGATINLPPLAGTTRWLAVAHAGHMRSQCSGLSLLIQVRGRARVIAREGRFELKPGDWLVLDRDSAPDVQADRHGLTLGVVAASEGSSARRHDLLPGTGRMSATDLRIALRLWRNGAETTGSAPPTIERASHAFQAVAQHVAALQRDMDAGIARCPGRSVSRKRQVFGRMQRAKLFLEGHRDRVVRLTELAELTSFSIWYLSKTYHEIYRESPQAASVRLRLERACELLADSVCSISEVGIACGFDNSCSFARAFRARYGMTASDYRQQRWNVAMDIGSKGIESNANEAFAAHAAMERTANERAVNDRIVDRIARNAHSERIGFDEPRCEAIVASVIDCASRRAANATLKPRSANAQDRNGHTTARPSP
ncbi:MAG: helix-turn-helix transcriptional regulator [Lysobacter sp.]|nr:helix-turn-helix transcriptional regulator [Lysobacter sp.]